MQAIFNNIDSYLEIHKPENFKFSDAQITFCANGFDFVITPRRNGVGYLFFEIEMTSI
jgi:hypothetical protein